MPRLTCFTSCEAHFLTTVPILGEGRFGRIDLFTQGTPWSMHPQQQAMQYLRVCIIAGRGLLRGCRSRAATCLRLLGVGAVGGLLAYTTTTTTMLRLHFHGARNVSLAVALRRMLRGSKAAL